jgi:small subunit ribosomal protein S6
LREYETTFIVQPEISDEGGHAIMSKLDDVLETGGATRLMCEDHGKRKLAYEVRKFHKGHYYTLMFLDEGSIVPDLERALRLEESVLRFLTILANEEVADVEARKSQASEAEQEQTKRAEERAVREAEEAAARREAEEAEREASLVRAAKEAEAAKADATKTTDAESGGTSEPAAETAKAEAAAPESDATPASAESEPETKAEEAAAGDAAADPTEEKS